jgi:enamine deaminase RidA (YjgF/YER057c/UK114 family)
VSIEHINPAELVPPEGYSQIVKVTGQSKVHIAGQSAFDKDMNLIGVQNLMLPEMLVDMTAVAAVD